MLIKRIETDDVIKGIYKSSNILASEYNTITKGLTIIFTNGGKYLYENVADRTFLRFEEADSQGKILNSHIKNAHSFINLGKVDVALITEELRVAKQESVISFGKLVIEQMKNIVNEYETNGILLDKESLGKLDKAINRYYEEVNK